MNLEDRLNSLIQANKNQGLYRQHDVLVSPQGVRVNIDNRQYLSFCSNDYLGLANDPALIQAAKQGLDQYGMGSGAAHLISGHTLAHQELEIALAEHLGRQRALLFSTGYMANLGLLNGLTQKGDLLLEDRLNHASLIDGGLMSSANFKRYQHNDVSHLERSLATHSEGYKFIATDSVFSMDGDVANLPEILRLADQHSATVIVDDAHGLGVLGKTGGGICEHFNLWENDQPIVMGTLGKAFGVFGAFVAGSDTLIDYLVQFARPYIYTTALPACVASASLQSLRKIQSETWRREKLQSLIHQFREGALNLGLQLMDSQTPIQPIVLGSAELAVQWSSALREKGFLVKAIRPPTVPRGTARLRITLSAAHSEEHVMALLNALGTLR